MTKKNMLSALGFLLLTLEIFGLAYSPSFGAQNLITYTVPGADVHAYNTNGIGDQYATTNASGQYLMNSTLTDIGNYTVEASANGYITANVNTTISSLSNQKTIDIILNRSAIIEGKVQGQNGHPVVGAYVALYMNGSYSQIDQTQTDANGMYYFATDVTAGVYYVTISFNFPTTHYGLPYQDAPYLANGYVEGNSQNIVATQGNITLAPTVILNQSGIIKGTVKDGLGHAIANATVSAYTFSPSYYSITTEADSNGVYRISYNVVNGTYTVTPSASGFVGASVHVVATQTGTVTQNLTMLKTATLTGNVWRKSDNKPVPKVDISLYDDSFTYFGSGITNATGSYAIKDGLGPGNYTVTAYLGGTTVNTTRVTLAAGENETLDFKVDAYFISGVVYANVTGGSRLAYPDVQLEFSNPTPRGGSTSGDANGNYVLALPIVSGTSGNTYSGNFTVSAYGYNTTIVNAGIVIGTDITNQNFVLLKSPPPPPPSSSATIKGTIYGNSGLPLPFSYQWWHLSDSGYNFMVGLNASSYVDFVFSSLSTKSIIISVWGPEGTTGQMTIWIPNAIYQGTFTVTSSPGPNPTMGTPTYNGTSGYWAIPITYGHSSKDIIVQSTSAVPEFQAPIALMTVLLLLSIALAVLLQKRRRFQVNQQDQGAL